MESILSLSNDVQSTCFNCFVDDSNDKVWLYHILDLNFKKSRFNCVYTTWSNSNIEYLIWNLLIIVFDCGFSHRKHVMLYTRFSEKLLFLWENDFNFSKVVQFRRRFPKNISVVHRLAKGRMDTHPQNTADWCWIKKNCGE
jgi:hypothetical protein